ncbi:2-oxo-4-hydroxy-4-carboxy-5-ureidoimidazoline decarboxylase [Kitasatospora mediocidica]|uniref:2-oxo-4-hydroxy-4-carboxy-5-ureidoimidazoline decarboxylase n=1 Tax=Kitasatospora mediocidica TaxID=58352 RepID=UPI000A7D041B|nr:2-oxo-4-hydroxy-4-carboxy-5-ureidoimidazoline decarboxylase [Kitasatospora mediocidica]
MRRSPPSRPHEEDPLASDSPADSSTDRNVEQPSTGIPPQRPDTSVAALATPAAAVGLHRFNEADPGAAEEALLACCGSHRWALRLTLHRPYPDLESLLAAASEASYDLRPSDLAEALADESWMPQPLLGMRAPGSQAAHTALRAAHAAYEARFGHVFVVCLDGIDPEEMLDAVLTSIRTRLANDPDEERLVASDELRRIALNRLEHLVASHTAGAH